MGYSHKRVHKWTGGLSSRQDVLWTATMSVNSLAAAEALSSQQQQENNPNIGFFSRTVMDDICCLNVLKKKSTNLPFLLEETPKNGKTEGGENEEADACVGLLFIHFIKRRMLPKIKKKKTKIYISFYQNC